MPIVVVMDLVLHEPRRILYAGRHGRSIYSYDLSQLPPTEGDGDGADNNHDRALGDPGAFASQARSIRSRSGPGWGAARR